MADLLERLRSHGGRGALVGGEGRGKSTLLGELAERLSGDGLEVRRITLHRGQSRVPSEALPRLRGLDERVALLVDGAEQLSALSWLTLRWRARSAGAFVVTSHRAGRLPTLLRCETSPGILLDLLNDLAPDRPACFPSAEALWRKHDGDLRQALFEAYDAWGRITPQVDSP